MNSLLLAAGLVLTSAAGSQVHSFRWEKHDHTGNQWNLIVGGAQVGSYRPGEDVYRPLLDFARNLWGPPCPPPCPLPEGVRLPSKVENGVKNFGVDMSQIPKGERYMMQGKEVPKEKAIYSMDKLPDDRDALWVVIAGGTDEQRKKVKEVMEQENVKDAAPIKYKVWDAPAGDWSLRDSETGHKVYKDDGNPTVYYLAPDGEVLHRQDSFEGPADYQTLRLARKVYDAKKDPSLKGVLWHLFMPNIDPGLIVLGLLGGAALILPKKGNG